MKKIFIIAGEASGDNIGASLVREIKKLNPNIQFKGIAGPQMLEQGVESIFPMQDVSVMGITDVLRKFFPLRKKLYQTFEEACGFEPDMVITIDFGGFNFRFVKMMRKKYGKHVKFIHYVAPCVWAYKPKRAAKVAELYDHILLILPIEKPYFDEVGLDSTFVGHPILESQMNIVPKNPNKILLMPGSRQAEIDRHAPIFMAVARQLSAEHPEYQFIIPTFSQFAEYLKNISHGLKVQIITEKEEAHREMQDCYAALAKSGSNTLDMMMCDIPTVVAYKSDWFTTLIAKYFWKIKRVTLCNILLDQDIVPELLDREFNISSVLDILKKLIERQEERERQLRAFAQVRKILQADPRKTASQLGAEVVLRLL